MSDWIGIAWRTAPVAGLLVLSIGAAPVRGASMTSLASAIALPDSFAGGISGDGNIVAGHVGCGARPWYLNRTTGVLTMPIGAPLPCGPNAPSRVNDLSRDGNVIVGTHWPDSFDGNMGGFIWAASSGILDLQSCPNSGVFVGCLPSGNLCEEPSACPNNGVSADGSVVAGTQNDLVFGDPVGEAFRWTAATGRVGLGFLPPDQGGPGGNSQANDVSADGNIIVGAAAAELSPFPLAVFWDATNTIRLIGALPGGFSGIASATNHDGSVIVGAGDTAPPPGVTQFPWIEPWIWRTGDETPTSLGFLITELPLPDSLPPGTDPATFVDDQTFIVHDPVAVDDGGTVVIGNVVGRRSVGIDVDGRLHTFLQQFNYAWIWRQGQGMQLLSDALTNDYGLDVSNWVLNGGFGEVAGMTPDGMKIVGHAHDNLNPISLQDAYLIDLTPCAADLTGDGTVDVFDLLDYLGLWFSGDAAAELTGDDPAMIDVFDLLVYLNSWFAGC